MMNKAALVLAIMLTAAACGGSDATSTATPDSSEAESPDSASADGDDVAETDSTTTTTAAAVDDEPAEQPEVGESGKFTVDGSEFAVTLLNRCIPFFDEPGNIDLQALAQGAQLNLTTLSGALDVSVQGSAIEQMFGSIAFSSDFVADAFDVSDDRITGSATVTDALGSGDTVDLTWDVMVPSEIRDCGL